MAIIADAKMYLRFLFGLPEFLRHTTTLEEAKEIVRRRMAEREINFLKLVERGIFNYPRSPYLPLLKLAQVELGDIRDMVRSKSLEDTLRALRGAGVYITFEEFKGKTPIVRGGKVISIRANEFDNPFLGHYYHAETGGTTGAGTRVPVDLDHLAERAPYDILAYSAYGVLDVPTAIWHGVLPDSTGVNSILTSVRIGKIPQKWFSPVMGRDLRPALKYRLATQCIVAAARASGIPVPWPRPLRLDQASTLARWAAGAAKAHGTCYVSASASRALRVCIAAREEGLDLAGAIFSGGGESPTEAKIREITRVGARCFPPYFFTEVGPVGMSCALPIDLNDQHFFKDGLGLIQHPRKVPGSKIVVDAFLFTTLLPTAPKLMLNVESDDYGIIETRSCGCPLENYGFTEHLRDIHSFRKLTGEAVTLAGSEMIRILEQVLPAKFGGGPLDYQLMEEEDEQGFTRANLLVSPKIHITDDAAVIDAVLLALSRSSVAADLARAHWSQAKTLRVKRMEPIWTSRGKLMPLHLTRRSEQPAGAQTNSTGLSNAKKPVLS